MSKVDDRIASKITEDEASIYDRQIRLWGLDAQKRLRAARVLVIGLGGLGSEVAKNTILAGVKSIHFMDDKDVTENDFKNQIFVRREDLKANRALSSIKNAQLLNPMVEVTAESSSIKEKSKDFFINFDVICASDLDWSISNDLDVLCRKQGIKLFLGSCFGIYGYMMADLGSHEYATEVKRELQDDAQEPAPKKAKVEEIETVTVKKVTEYLPLETSMKVNWCDEKNSVKLKKTPTGFFLCRIVSEFIAKHKRIPEMESREEDRKFLEEVRAEVLKDLSIGEAYIPLEYLDNCYGELSPVCAIVGGILAQDIIKAVSKKDLPHNNFFFFDGMNGCGMVDQIADL